MLVNLAIWLFWGALIGAVLGQNLLLGVLLFSLSALGAVAAFLWTTLWIPFPPVLHDEMTNEEIDIVRERFQYLLGFWSDVELRLRYYLVIAAILSAGASVVIYAGELRPLLQSLGFIVEQGRIKSG